MTLLRLSRYRPFYARRVPLRHYKDEGFVERTIEINEEDLPAIIEEYLLRMAIVSLMKPKSSINGR